MAKILKQQTEHHDDAALIVLNIFSQAKGITNPLLAKIDSVTANVRVENGVITDIEEEIARHYDTTGPEIWEKTEGRVDLFIACVCAGGVISGAGKYLREQCPHVHIYAVKIKSDHTPDDPRRLTLANPDIAYADGVFSVRKDDAVRTARDVFHLDGLMVNTPAGAALHAAARLALRHENYGKNIVVYMPDTGDHNLCALLNSFDDFSH